MPLCVEEATGQNRDGLYLVSKTAESLGGELTVAKVDDAMRFILIENLGEAVILDAGERDLLALAYSKKREAWWLCGPDKETLRALHHFNRADRMVSLEEAMRLAGCKCDRLETVQTKRWLEEKRTKLKLGDTPI